MNAMKSNWLHRLLSLALCLMLTFSPMAGPFQAHHVHAEEVADTIRLGGSAMSGEVESNRSFADSGSAEEYPDATVEIPLRLKLVDATGDKLIGTMDACLNESGEVRVGTSDCGYGPVTCVVGENTLMGWEFHDDDYLAPTGMIIFRADEAGEIRIVEGDATVETADGYTYIVITLEPAPAVSIPLYLKAVDVDGKEIEGKLDARLNQENSWVGTAACNYPTVECRTDIKNYLTAWKLCPDGYGFPVEDITFTADEAGRIEITSGNATVETAGGNTYIVVTLEESVPLYLDMGAVTIDAWHRGVYVYCYDAATGLLTTDKGELLENSSVYAFYHVPAGTKRVRFLEIFRGKESVLLSVPAGSNMVVLTDETDDNGRYLGEWASYKDPAVCTCQIKCGAAANSDCAACTADPANCAGQAYPQITHVGITVDGVECTSGTAEITEETQSIIVTAYGTDLDLLTENHRIRAAGAYSACMNDWQMNAAGNGVTWDYTELHSAFLRNLMPAELQLSDDGGQTWTGTGVFTVHPTDKVTRYIDCADWVVPASYDVRDSSNDYDAFSGTPVHVAGDVYAVEIPTVLENLRFYNAEGGLVGSTVIPDDGSDLYTINSGTWSVFDPSDYCTCETMCEDDGSSDCDICAADPANCAGQPPLFTIAASMAPEKDLTMTFTVDPAKLRGDGHYAIIIHRLASGSLINVTIDQADWNNGSFTYSGFAAKQMTEQITVIVCDRRGNPVSQTYNGSIRDCLMAQIAAEEAGGRNQKKLRLWVDTLNYGAAAQEYFGFNTGDLANSLLSADQKAYATGDVAAKDERSLGAGYAGSTLALDHELRLNFVFNNSVVKKTMRAVFTYTSAAGVAQTITLDGSQFTKYSNTRWRVTVAIPAVDAAQLVTCTIMDGDTAVTSVTDSMESYMARTSAKPIFVTILKYTRSAAACLQD